MRHNVVRCDICRTMVRADDTTTKSTRVISRNEETGLLEMPLVSITICNKCVENADDELRLKNEEEKP